MTRSTSLALIIGTAIQLAGMTGSAVAQDNYPTREITLVVPFAAGGGADLIGRHTAEGLSAVLGMPVVVDNRPGAGTVIGTEHVRHAEPDGHTLILISNSFVINSVLGDVARIDPVEAFEHISLLAGNSYALVVNPDLGFDTLEQFLDAVREKPGEYNYASAGNLTGSDLAARVLMSAEGLDMAHIPYPGAAPANLAVVAGEVDAFFGVVSGLRAHLASGGLVALAVTTDERDPLLPEVPTMRERGVDMNFPTWFGLSAPSGTPSEIVQTLADAVAEGFENADLRRRVEEAGNVIHASTPEVFTQMVADEAALLQELSGTLDN